MKTFNCSINQYIEAETEEAVQMFLDKLEMAKTKDIDCFEHNVPEDEEKDMW